MLSDDKIKNKLHYKDFALASCKEIVASNKVFLSREGEEIC
jgi:hypothetical protein